MSTETTTSPVRRCGGSRVVEVRGLKKNEACEEKATVTRELKRTGKEPALLHFCEVCAKDWDAQQRLIASMMDF